MKREAFQSTTDMSVGIHVFC